MYLRTALAQSVPNSAELRRRPKGEMAEWSIVAVSKAVELQGSGGSNPSLSAKRLQSDCKMVVREAFKTRVNRCRTWSYNDFSLYAVHRPDGLPLGSNSHQSVKFCYTSLIPALLTDGQDPNESETHRAPALLAQPSAEVE